MQKLLFLCSRQAALTHEAYVEYLLTRHAPLAQSHLVGLRGYVLDIVDRAHPDAPAVDSINALYYDTVEGFTMDTAEESAAGRALAADHSQFLGGAAGYLTREHTIQESEAIETKQGTDGSLKWILALKVKPDISHADFLETVVGHSLPALYDHRASFIVSAVEQNLYGAGEDWAAFLELPRAPDDAAPPAELLNLPDVHHTVWFGTTSHVRLSPPPSQRLR